MACIGLIVPPAAGEVMPEARAIYPEVTFLARGIGIEAVSAAAFDKVGDRIEGLALELRDAGAEAVGVMGTSLSFYKGAAYNAALAERLRQATGLPVTTMSDGIRDGLRALGARRLAVGTAYTEDLNRRLAEFLEGAGFEVGALVSLGLSGLADIRGVTEAGVVELGVRAVAEAEGPVDAVLISCGGLRSETLAPMLEPRVGLPVVASATAGLWSTARLLGLPTDREGFGRLGLAG